MSSSEGTSGRDCAADNATLLRRGVKSIDYTHYYLFIIKPRLTRHMSVTKEDESQARNQSQACAPPYGAFGKGRGFGGFVENQSNQK